MVCVHRLSVLAMLILVFPCGPALATDHEHLPADHSLRRTIYYILSTDPELQGCSCGLSVYQGGIVVLWGRVCSPEWLDKAMRTIRDCEGVNKIVNRCQITPPPDPALERFEARLNNTPLPNHSNLIERPDPLKGVVVAKPIIETPSLRDICDQIRKNDDRFSGLLFEIRVQRIHIKGTVLSKNHLDEFTKQLSPYTEGRIIDVSQVRIIEKK